MQLLQTMLEFNMFGPTLSIGKYQVCSPPAPLTTTTHVRPQLPT